jgi:hypothetical protein
MAKKFIVQVEVADAELPAFRALTPQARRAFVLSRSAARATVALADVDAATLAAAQAVLPVAEREVLSPVRREAIE